MRYSVSALTAILSATCHGPSTGEIQFLLTDSRSLCFPAETLFFCLKTATGDGAAYIPSLLSRGVRHFVVDKDTTLPDEDRATFLVVDNTLAALQRLAAYHRQQYDIPVVGITGSNGKTIVKEWLAQIMSDRVVTRSPRSYNSQIGVPLSLCLLDGTSELALIEAGISEPGEMAKLAEMIAPTVVVFTFLGAAHGENFKSLEEKGAEKMLLSKGVETAIMGGDDAAVRHCLTMVAPSPRQVLTWSRHDETSTLYVVREEQTATTTTVHYRYGGEDDMFTIPFISRSAVDNALSCALTALHLGISRDVLRQKMGTLEPVAMRLSVVEGQRNNTIINDSYNSDINSLQIALDFLHRRSTGTGKTTVVVLSDILQAPGPHKVLYSCVDDMLHMHHVDILIGIGDDVAYHNAAFLSTEAHFFRNVDTFLASTLFRTLHDSIILLKGARRYGFERIEEHLVAKGHETRLTVDLSALAANLSFFRRQLPRGTKMMCMVKADGYGMGAVEVAKTLQENNVDFLAVAVADEGVLLRRHGIQQNIIVMNPEIGTLATLFDYALEPEVYSFRLLDALIAEGTRQGVAAFPCHLKIDSGMHRLGFTADDIPSLIRRLQQQKAIIPRSVFSHFAAADDSSEGPYTTAQYETFDSISRQIIAAFPHTILRHMCNTAAMLAHPSFHLDMCRLGIGLYGINPLDNSTLHTVATLTTVILQIRSLPAGATVGYNRRGALRRDSRIAAIAIGYGDGMARAVGNGKGYCLVNGQRAPFVGNICMDVSMIDVTEIDCHEGDSVEIFGAHLPVAVVAAWRETIPYEVLTTIGPRVKRVYIKE